jgi:bifunctional polynucleotide phosphatase/kinase
VKDEADYEGNKRPASGASNGSTAIGTSNQPPTKKRASGPLTSSAQGIVHPFFSAKPTTLGNFVSSPPTVCHFLHLDPFKTETKPESAPVPEAGPSSGLIRKSVTIVFYDLDGTLIKPRSGSEFPSGRADWTWWDVSVPGKMKAEWEEGKHLVVLSNQGDTRPKIREEWKAKLPLIMAKVCFSANDDSD